MKFIHNFSPIININSNMKQFFAVILLFSTTFFTNIFAQNTTKGLVSGPMLGYVEHRAAMIWAEVGIDVNVIQINYWEKGKKDSFQTVFPSGIDAESMDNTPFYPVKFELNNLRMNTTYEYQVLINETPVLIKYPLTFKTKELWEWRKPAPDFSFLTGSCAYINDPEYDRPKPYGNDPNIFRTMAKTPASFMLWLGDNNYLREADYSSNYGIAYRYSHDRATPELQPLLAAMPHFAIWDDHDYGPNDSDKSWVLKESARNCFKKYWCNHSYGEDKKGVYTHMRYGDCEFFMLDNRYFRSADDMLDSINGKPNEDKLMFGKQQMDWLKNALLSSNATFKFIVSGSQVLNPIIKSENWRSYPYEFQDFMNFLDNNRLSGVLFLSGDIHRTEIIKIDRKNNYSLFDITSSSITAGVNTQKLNENPYRIGGSVQENNFTKVSVSGPKNDRALKFEFININGEIKSEFKISEKELKIPRF